MALKKLTGKQKRYLRGLAHSMKPSVNIGKNGLTESLFQEVDECLLAHELIKIKILDSCTIDKKECSVKLGGQARSHVAQIIGRTILLYREHPEEPAITLPS